MAVKKPLCLYNGEIQQLQSGDTISISDVTLLEKITFDGMGSVCLVNSSGYFRARAAGTITGWSIVAAGTNPTCTFDIYKIATGTILPTSSITASAQPALSTGNAIYSTSMAGWTLTFAINDIFEVKLTACTAATWIDFEIYT